MSAKTRHLRERAAVKGKLDEWQTGTRTIETRYRDALMGCDATWPPFDMILVTSAIVALQIGQPKMRVTQGSRSMTTEVVRAVQCQMRGMLTLTSIFFVT